MNDRSPDTEEGQHPQPALFQVHPIELAPSTDNYTGRARVRRHRFSASVRVVGPEAARILRRTVPTAHRHREPGTGNHRVYDSHLDRLVNALRAGGIEVDDDRGVRP